MSQITERMPINASADEVWQVLADFGGVERWAPAVLKSHCSTNVHRGLGAKRILTASTGETTEEAVVEWNEGHSFTFEISDGLASTIKIFRETWCVEHSSQGAEVVVIMDYQMKEGVVYSILDALVARRVLKKMLVQNLAGLKHHIETGEIVTPKRR